MGRGCVAGNGEGPAKSERHAVGTAAGRLCRGLSAGRHLLLLCFSALGLAAFVLHRRASRFTRAICSLQGQRIGSLEEDSTRDLGSTWPQYRFALEAFHLPDAVADDDELCFPRHTGHVPYVSRAPVGL